MSEREGWKPDHVYEDVVHGLPHPRRPHWMRAWGPGMSAEDYGEEHWRRSDGALIGLVYCPDDLERMARMDAYDLEHP